MRDQVITGSALPVCAGLGFGASLDARALGALIDAPGDFDFRVARSARKIFDGVAVGIARGEIHLGEFAAVAENLVDQADAFKKVLPFEGGHQPHAGDDVADGHAHGRLLLMLGADDFIGAGALGGEASSSHTRTGRLWDRGRASAARVARRTRGRGARSRVRETWRLGRGRNFLFQPVLMIKPEAGSVVRTDQRAVGERRPGGRRADRRRRRRGGRRVWRRVQ